MKFFCEKKIFMDAISTTQKAVSSKSTLAQLEGILIELKGNTLNMTGYDLEMGIKCSIQVNGEMDGAVIVNSKLMGEIIRSFSEKEIYFEKDDKNLILLKSGMAEFRIVGLPSSDFPELPKIVSENSLSISQQKLKSMIEQTIHAVMTIDTRPIQMGERFEIKDGIVTVVAVDGCRLAMRKEEIEDKDKDFSFVVPGKALSEIIHILKEDDTAITVSLSKKHILFEIENVVMFSRLLEGEFLNYRNAIPVEKKITVEADVKTFVESVERAALLINEKIKSPLKCKIEYDVIKIECMTSQGKINDEFKVTSSGGNLEMGFNSRFLLDSLKNCKKEKVKIEMTTQHSPMVIKPVEGEDFLFLVVPVRLKNEA